MIMNKINTWKFIFMFWISSHLGKNPRKGGSPPKDRRFMKIRFLLVEFILIEVKMWLNLNKLNKVSWIISVMIMKE